MNKKLIMRLVLLLVLVIGSIWAYQTYGDKSLKEITGKVTEVNGSVVTLEGSIGAKIKVIKFTVTDKTEFNKSVSVVTAEQLKSEGSFTPERRLEQGVLSDLAIGKYVVVRSKEDLIPDSVTTATAVQFDYAGGYEFPAGTNFMEAR